MMNITKYRKYVLNYYTTLRPINNDVSCWFSTTRVLSTGKGPCDYTSCYLFKKGIYCVGWKLLFFMGKVEMFYPIYTKSFFDLRKRVNRELIVDHFVYMLKLKLRYHSVLLKKKRIPYEVIGIILDYI